MNVSDAKQWRSNYISMQSKSRGLHRTSAQRNVTVTASQRTLQKFPFLSL